MFIGAKKTDTGHFLLASPDIVLSWYSLNTDSRRVFGLERGKSTQLAFPVREIYHFCDSGLMVWVGIMANDLIELFIHQRCSVIARRYMDEEL